MHGGVYFVRELKDDARHLFGSSTQENPSNETAQRFAGKVLSCDSGHAAGACQSAVGAWPGGTRGGEASAQHGMVWFRMIGEWIADGD